MFLGSTHEGCLHERTSPQTPLPVVQHVSMDQDTVVVRGTQQSMRDVDEVARLVPAAMERVRAAGLQWRVGLLVVVHESVSSFVRSTGQTTSSLRAWSTWDTIHLLNLATWAHADDDAVVARLAHELCHLALFQRFPDAETARLHPIPRFVAEGVCSVVADQGAERLSLEHTRARVDEDVDFESNPALSYAYAHHVFAQVLMCRGLPAMLRVVDQAAHGERVENILGASPRRWLLGCPDDSASAPSTGTFHGHKAQEGSKWQAAISRLLE